jgi:hypothetical protein
MHSINCDAYSKNVTLRCLYIVKINNIFIKKTNHRELHGNQKGFSSK